MSSAHYKARPQPSQMGLSYNFLASASSITMVLNYAGSLRGLAGGIQGRVEPLVESTVEIPSSLSHEVVRSDAHSPTYFTSSGQGERRLRMLKFLLLSESNSSL